MNALAASANNLRGILLMVAAMALFGVEDMFLKWAATDLPVGQILFVSGAFGAPVFWAMARRQGRRIFVKDALQPAVLARNIGEMVGSVGYIAALATVPLSTVSAVLQAMPLAVTMAAAVFMQEQVGWRRWAAIGVGFAGVLIVIRPGADGFRMEALWVLVTVAALTLRDLASRRIPAVVTTSQVSAWGLIAVAALGLAMMLLTGDARAVTAGEAAVLAGAVGFGTAGYWAVTAASRTGEVAVVSPFRYTRLIFALAVGVIVFGERPDGWTYLGAALIIGSGLYSYSREWARKRASQLG